MDKSSKPGRTATTRTLSSAKSRTGQEKTKPKPARSWLLPGLLAAALLLSACSSAAGGFWVPPSSLSTQPPVSLLSTTPVDLPVIEPSPTSGPLVTEIPAIPTSAPTETLIPSPTPGPTDTPVLPSGEQTPPPPVDTSPYLYYVQAADTLPAVAVRFNVQPEEIDSPDPIDPTGVLPPGQLLVIPRRLVNTSSAQHILPDSEVVYSPSATDFDIDSFVSQAGGKLSTYTEWHTSSGTLSGAQVVQRVALENSINPRLLLALMEYANGWVYGQPVRPGDDNPLGLENSLKRGVYHQLVWAVNQLSVGYYTWREGRLNELKFSDGVTARLAPDLNAGSAAVQYYFAQIYDSQRWLQAVDPANGFPALYERMFGSPAERASRVEPLYPPGLTQPPMILPFTEKDFWSYTGGPHGAWEHDGSYAAIDFAPPSSQSGCVKSNVWVTAAASGLVARSGNGIVVLDLDGDGREQTGWVLLYLHVSTVGRIPVGSWVETGAPLGHPSCEGGLATGTHVHLARKYNGEWIAAGGPMPFVLSGWTAEAGKVAYQGKLVRDGQVVEACTCSSAKTRIGRSPQDP